MPAQSPVLIYGSRHVPEAWRTLNRIKNILSTGVTINRDEDVLNALLNQAPEEQVALSDVRITQRWIYIPEFCNQAYGRETAIMGLRAKGDNRVWLHEGHHRIAKMITEGKEYATIKVYDLPEDLSQMLLESL